MKKMMKALVFPSKWKVELVETEVSRPGPNEVLAEIRCVGICGPLNTTIAQNG
jgi:D-arabinose 1-dehydrogenase-like Zn-dependent alcohol dehydrogenase